MGVYISISCQFYLQSLCPSTYFYLQHAPTHLNFWKVSSTHQSLLISGLLISGLSSTNPDVTYSGLPLHLHSNSDSLIWPTRLCIILYFFVPSHMSPPLSPLLSLVKLTRFALVCRICHALSTLNTFVLDLLFAWNLLAPPSSCILKSPQWME